MVKTMNKRQKSKQNRNFKIKGYFYFCLGSSGYRSCPPPKTIRKLKKNLWNICFQTLDKQYWTVIPKRRQTGEVSPVIAQPFCLETISGLQPREREPKQTQKSYWAEETEFGDQECQNVYNVQGRVLERQKLCKQRAQEIVYKPPWVFGQIATSAFIGWNLTKPDNELFSGKKISREL